MSTEEQASIVNGPSFRATKRRKIYRRPDSDGGEEANADQLLPTESVTPASNPQADQEMNSDTAKDARLPKVYSGKVRRGGVAFSSSREARPPLAPDEGAFGAMAKVEDASAMDKVTNRFAPQTGVVAGQYDSQMDAFVEAEMAKIRAGAATTMQDMDTKSSGRALAKPSSHHEATALGRLQEVELGSSASARKASQHDKQGQGSTQDPSSGIQLNRNGKPRRKRWRRGSEDLKRDSLVDAILKETKLGVYDEDTSKDPTTNDSRDEEAFAAQFEKQFLENDEKRRQPPPPPSKVAKGEDKKAKGPKLGGSRSARAAMHAQERTVSKR
ncbi:MAG: hypothetical protein M1828_003058 [Chrysothrix sp. TS-e1954]|nr:MAG: hypothetical protein M1828_003058 [Chrysothrix sp. TS-e1954]